MPSNQQNTATAAHFRLDKPELLGRSMKPQYSSKLREVMQVVRTAQVISNQYVKKPVSEGFCIENKDNSF
jgi:hypothetical protein